MENTFRIALLGGKISQDYINPGEALFVTLNLQNQGKSRPPGRYRFVMDVSYGHQRKLENKQYNYRCTADAFPSAELWEPGMETAVTLRWEAATPWSGTYHLKVGILDTDDVRVPFFVPGHGMVTSFTAGAVDVSWNFGRPWVAENARPVVLEHCQGGTQRAAASIPRKQDCPAITLTDGVDITVGRNEPRIIAIGGNFFNYAAPEISVKRLNNKAFTARAEFSLVSQNETEAAYRGRAYCGDALAAAFTLCLGLKGRVLTVMASDIVESEGFELLSIKYPTFAEISGGYLLDFYGGGRLVPINEAAPLFFEKPYDVRNAAALYNSGSLLIVESTHLDSRLISGVYSVNGQQRGFIGGIITCRIPAEGDLPGIPIKTPPAFTIEACDTKGEAPHWTMAASLLRRGVKPNWARDLYRGVYFYKQLATWGPKPDESYRNTDNHPSTQRLFNTVTFAEITENVRKFANLTDHTRQVVYVTGFQKGGFDNAYPYPFDAEERCGGLDGLRRCLEDIRKHNALSGLHDNFDDVSYENVARFPHVAMDAGGKPWHGWVWPAGPTFIAALPSYVESGDMAARVKTMNELLPLKDSYHLDVLTAETCRYDFNPAHPASAEDSFRAKALIVAEWNKYGIDITSEMLSHPSAGLIGFALHTRLDTKEVFIPGESFVPLVHMVYHGIVGYTAPSTTMEEMLWSLLIGGQTFHEENITGPLCVSRFYIQNIPAMKLYDKFMTDFKLEGGYARADYGEGSYVSVDFTSGTYRVVVDNALIGQDFSVFVPANSPGAYLAYAFNDKPVVYPMPAAANPRAVVLTEEGEGAVLKNAVRRDGDNIILTLPPMTPVKIYFE